MDDCLIYNHRSLGLWAATSLVGRSPQGETEDVATLEESFGETRFEGVLSVRGDVLCLSVDLLPKQRPPLVGLFPDVIIKCQQQLGKEIGIPHRPILKSILDQRFVPMLPTRYARRCHVKADRLRIGTGQS